MTIAGWILAGACAILLLLLLLPLGIYIGYGADGATLKLVVGCFSFRLYPRKKKRRKVKKQTADPPKSASASPESDAQKRGGKLSAVKPYIPVALELLQGIRHRLLVRRLTLLVNLAGDDPCDLALEYGKISGAVGSLMPLLERAFRIQKRDVQVFCDFTSAETEVYLNLQIVACPVRLLPLLLRCGLKTLKLFITPKTNKAV